MKKTLSVLALLLAAVMLTGCSKTEEKAESAAGTDATAPGTAVEDTAVRETAGTYAAAHGTSEADTAAQGIAEANEESETGSDEEDAEVKPEKNGSRGRFSDVPTEDMDRLFKK